MIAKDLYLLRQEVEMLEEQVKNAPFEKQEELKDILRKKKAELNRMQRMLDGAKEPPSYRKPR
jgi:cell division protein FtsL